VTVPATDDLAWLQSAPLDDPCLRDAAGWITSSEHSELEWMARRARALTERHFGRTVSLYAPLYLSDYCSSGCVYCGFASDRTVSRYRLAPEQVRDELDALRGMGLEEVLLLTGERSAQADLAYVEAAVRAAADRFPSVTVEAFAMSTDEYRVLAAAGCTGVTLYQETYDEQAYSRLHRWGTKRDYAARLRAPARALDAGIRTVGLGVLFGLSDPVQDTLRLLQHARVLQRCYWRSGIALSFPRFRPQTGGFVADHAVEDALMARIIFSARLCLPDVTLVLSTRERPAFRDGMAGLGINKMSVASRTTVGGYARERLDAAQQFNVEDHRCVEAICEALRGKGLDPVFKNWDPVFRDVDEAGGAMGPEAGRGGT
jgi:2-iminoacetate synthase